MEEIDLATIKKRSVVGILALTSRTFFLQIINFVSTLLLTIFLAPEIFGIFFVVSAVVNFLNYFSDIGLAAALIQKKEKLTREDLKTTFTIQQILVVSLSLLALFMASKIGDFYHFSPAALLLFKALVISFFLSSLKTIPSVMLERKLDFNRLIIPQIVETILFNLIAVFLAWRGAGITSFTVAVLARGVSGLVLIYLISPWKPGLDLNKKSAKRLLSFGAPFQANSLLALLKDDLLTVFLGKVLPFSQVGFIGWAQKWANTPLRFIMDSIIRVTFPAYSRLQNNLPALRAGVEKSLFIVSLFTFPALVGLIFCASSLVYVIPRYLKWEPALIALYFFSIQAMISSISTILTNTLNAVGKIKITLGLMILWTGLTWIFTPVFIYFFGYKGVAIAALAVSLTIFAPIMALKKVVDFSLIKSIFAPLVSSFIMGGFLFLALPKFNLFLTIIVGAIIYSGFIFVLVRKKISEIIGLAIESFKK